MVVEVSDCDIVLVLVYMRLLLLLWGCSLDYATLSAKATMSAICEKFVAVNVRSI